MKTTRIAPGAYEVTHDGQTVKIDRFDHLPKDGPQWIAAAGWDRYCYTDPLWTLRDAKAAAVGMLTDAKETR